MKAQTRIWWLFHLLVIYVFLQFSWWAYMLFDLNTLLFEQNDILKQLKPPGSPAIIAEGETLDKKLWMIVGEGSVFLFLLLIGVLYLHRVIRKEIAIARQQKNFLMSVTHEFNSPLASIKLALQTLLRRNLPKEKNDKILTNALSETERLGGLVDNLLLATRIENSNYHLYRESADLSNFVSDFLEKSALTVNASHQVELQVEPDIEFSFDSLAVASILSNLLENAAKYSPKGSCIQVILQKKGAEIALKVADEGQGIPSEERQRVFDKFYRVGNEETRNTKGTGLGLYLTRFLVSVHQGTIRISDNNPRGTIFDLRFKNA
ncbi:MAG: sensor histidine kinase [Salibacteraceae bacterium]